MKLVVSEQALGFVATVCQDGSANLSPKGTLRVYDEEHLVFLDLSSPGTMRNLSSNPSVEVNVVDPIVRKGYRFKGRARIVPPGGELERILDFFGRGPGPRRERVRGAVVIEVLDAAPLISPSYDEGASEEEVISRWREHHLSLRETD